MNTLNNVIRFNAEAAGLILSGRYTNAITILSSSLQCLKGAKRQRGRGKQSSHASEIGTTSCLSSSVSAPSLSTVSSLNIPAQSQRSSGYIFREPIIACGDVDDTPAKSRQRMVAIVLYNLALAHHLQGLRVQKDSASLKATSHLQTAQSMYEACLKIQIKHQFDLGDFYKLLVLPNNIGQVAMALGKTQSAKGYMTFLAKQLDQFLQSPSFPCRETEIEEFLNNTIGQTNPFGATQIVPC
ncbi:unnamed protein product [Cylindrotheca closterium]|uniref:Uncharacterized protein n=1 Tax=Cylindrotheca closterium TaxID=2856 RepID=A0AAD2FMW5_9STRA|nr:unnamed protein product [Cylindrotheca closterium]